MRITRKRWRTRTRLFCSATHYWASREKPGYVESRRGGQLARAVVIQHFQVLESEHVVHHVDGDQRNNDLRNLEVYATHGEHMRHHHGRKVEPLWRGADHRP